MRCIYCGKDLPEGSKFCDGCGAKQEVQNEMPTSYQDNYQGYYQQGGYQPSGNKKNIGLIIGIIVAVLALIIGIVLFLVLGGKGDSDKTENNGRNTNTNTNTNTEPGPNIEKDSKKLAENIEYNDYKIDDNTIILIVKNNNKSTVSLEAEIEYIDKEGVVVDHDSGYAFGLAPGKEVVIDYYITDKEYDKYKITFDAEPETYYKSHVDEIKIVDKVDKENEEVILTVTNNSKEKIDELRIGVLFYKNGKIVGYEEESEYDVDSGKSIALYVDFPFVGFDKTFEFDEYKLYILRANSETDSRY